MATREKIEFDFKQALRQADRIDTIASNLSELSGKEFGGSLENLSANWKGDNASIYMAKGNRLQEQMNGTAKELHAVAADIRVIARRLYNAEMNAWRIANSRTY